jgi:hypothetical protein
MHTTFLETPDLPTAPFEQRLKLGGRLAHFRDCSHPIVPAALRGAFLAERWIAGRPCVVQQSICSFVLLVDVSFAGGFCEFGARYCYTDAEDALVALRDWDGRLDPPGQWTKEVISGRMGPGAFEDRAS